MGRREVRVVLVRKPVTIVLLVLVSAAMAALIYALSGKAYANDMDPLRLIVQPFMRSGHVSRSAVLSGLMPFIANMLLFIPWGFLMFLAIDKPERRRSRSYLMTVVASV